MKERLGVVTSKGKQITLLGNEVKVGDKAPAFTVIGNDLSEVNLSAFAGKVILISSVPSLDTSVCDIETRRFNEEAGNMVGDVHVLTISMDLPFAQKRWCAAKDVENLTTLSDHRDASFGLAYGVLIKESRLLARTIFIIDRNGIIRYIQMVKDISTEPDYENVLKALETIRSE